MSTPRLIQFVGHYAGRTGAPRLLLRLLVWVRDRNLARTRLHLKTGGPLVDEYRRVAPTTLDHDKSKQSRLSRLASKVYRSESSATKLDLEQVSLLFANTVVPLE